MRIDFSGGKPTLINDQGQPVLVPPFITGGVCTVSSPVAPPVSPPVSPPPPPPGIPAQTTAADANRVPGSLWVSGTDLFYVASDTTTWSGTGTSIDTPVGAIAGSMYVDGDNVKYIDASGTRRSLQVSSFATRPTGAIQGSMWLNSPSTPQKQLRWIGSVNLNGWWNGF